MSKKLVTGFAQIFVCEIKIYLFGSYLRFKSVYRLLGIKLYDLPPESLKCPLKIQIKAYKNKKPTQIKWIGFLFAFAK